MPSLSQYKKQLGSHTNGDVRKTQSDLIMENTWWEDVSARTAYLCDYYHDDEILLLNNLHPDKDKKKIPIDIKFLQSASQTYDKDQVTFHLQLRPSQLCNVPYYDEVFGKRYNAMFPVGLYIIIQDEKGVWNRWLIVDRANINATQFPTFEILRCDYVFQYIMDNKKVQIPGVLRSQNSYNSGIWTDYKTTSIEDQQKFAVPLNRDTEKIYYTSNQKNLRMIIDGKVLTEPRAWKVTKVNRISPNGIARITLAQDLFDQHKDYIEFDENNNVIGMWADYFNTEITPTNFVINDNDNNKIYGEFKYSSLPQLKVGGSYKKFTLTFYENNEEIPLLNGNYYFFINDEDVSDLITTINDENVIKIKFLGGDEFIGNVLTIKYITDNGIKISLDVEIVGL